MLIIEDKEYHQSVLSFAEKINNSEQLKAKLNYLDNYSTDTECHLFRDFAPQSFYFVLKKLCDDGSYKTWFNGGLIFHQDGEGKETGNWSVHT